MYSTVCAVKELTTELVISGIVITRSVNRLTRAHSGCGTFGEAFWGHGAASFAFCARYNDTYHRVICVITCLMDISFCALASCHGVRILSYLASLLQIGSTANWYTANWKYTKEE